MESKTDLNYSAISKRMAAIADLNSAASLLQWDQETYMPSGAGEARAQQLATLYGLAHDQFTDSETLRLLESLQNNPGCLSDEETLSVDRLWRDYKRKTCLDREFVEKLSIQISRCFHAWEKARKEKNFEVFAPELETLVDLKREEAERIGYSESPYDALLDEYEPGMKASELNRIFGVLLPELDTICSKIGLKKNIQTLNDAAFALSEEKQWSLCRDVLEMIGFDSQYGRLDKSSHPFSIGMHPSDVRITTRFNTEDLCVGLWSTLHEAGHAFYEMGLDASTRGMPLSEAASLGIHESQSRLWENQIGRSMAFLRYIEPALSKAFDGRLPHDFMEKLHQKLNRIESGLIRTEADELTYHYHIFIRYQIELDMIEGRLKIKDLKARWNDMYETYLGIKPGNDAEGILQDVHWSHGSIGYFPTYTLGSIYAAQLYNTASLAIPDLTTVHTFEYLSRLKVWLKHNVFGYGRTLNANAICHKSTNNELNPLEFVSYIKNKIDPIQPNPTL
jgi:carboxypeptidase Taq